MLRKFVALVALALGLVMALGAPAVADPYTPIIPTQVVITITSEGPGQPTAITVRADADSTQQPTGDIDMQVSQSAGVARAARAVAAAPLYAKTVRFEGRTVRFTGPRLPQGTYMASATFTPDDAALFLGSDNNTRLRIAAVGAGGGSQGGAAGGGLPNTGGPDLMWLLLGGGLVAAGVGGLSYGRRGQTIPA